MKFETTINGWYLTRYFESPDKTASRNRSLYETANRKVWNASTDLHWALADALDDFPTHKAAEPLSGFPAYESLSRPQRIALSWQRHAMDISEILHGEQGALLLASQLISGMPTHDGKLFTSSQVSDEARHVDFFARYLHHTTGKVYPPSECLQDVLMMGLSNTNWEIKFIICQLLIESLALARFSEIHQTTRLPLLRSALELILKDEARHVKFGVDALKSVHVNLATSELENRSDFVINSALTLCNININSVRIAREQGWNVAALRKHLRHYQLRHPELARNRLRQLTLNMTQAGLMTDKTRQRLQQFLQQFCHPTNSPVSALQSGQ